MTVLKCNNKSSTLASRLPSYKPLNIIIRVVIISIVAICLLHLIVFVISNPAQEHEPIPIRFYLIFIFAFLISSEIQIALDTLLEKILPIPNKVRLRLSIQIITGLFMLFVVLKVVMSTIDPDSLNEHTGPGVYMGLLTGLLFVFMLAHALILMRFTEKWAASQNQISEMKREKLMMDYNSLQDQLNPHFLFNNLSVLKSLIIYDQDSAVKFTENFTDVYRYVLQSNKKRLVKLVDELKFIESYIGLHKERLGEGLFVKYSIHKEQTEMKIPPLTLQLLIENAIKHNIASTETPLVIEVMTVNDYLVVQNNFQPRDTSYSTKTGLSNMMKRYDMLTKKKIKIHANNSAFKIEIPLL